MMTSAKTSFLPIAEPVDHDRQDVPYPIGLDIDSKQPGLVVPLFEKGNEYEPLEAGLGRYIMIGTCGNLKETNGWERCGKYQRRPDVCRDFEVGGEKCKLLRQMAGLKMPPEPEAE